MKTRQEVICDVLKDNTQKKMLSTELLITVNQHLGDNRSVTLRSLGHIIPGLNRQFMVNREVIQNNVYYTFFEKTT